MDRRSRMPLARGATALVAVLLSALCAGAVAAQKRTPPRLKGGSEVVLPVAVKGAEGMSFHLHLPSGWTPKSKAKYPVLLALHGNGQAPQGNFAKFRALSTKKTPLIVVAPHYQKEPQFNAEVWPREVCLAVFDWLREQSVTEWHGDSTRFFVQGFSMGGSYASLYVAHAAGATKAGEPLGIRGAILNSGTAWSPQMSWPKNLPSLFIVGEKETAVRGSINVVASMRQAANGFLRQGGDVRFHLIQGMGHAVNAECVELARALLFEECAALGALDREIADLKRRIRQETRPLSRLRQLEQAAAARPGAAPDDAIHRSLAQLRALPAMVRELEALTHWEAAVQADRQGAADRRAAYEALVRSHPDTEAGRRAKNRLDWMD
ncbi:MAG: alpha/beta hydrolase fold domain-containing protein [Planctomycetes bacterium]|nr:alpha/beta hydrolase fold domain-containing protein [Planctomycetota bacterium]